MLDLTAKGGILPLTVNKATGNPMWNVWVWEQPEWRVLATYQDYREAKRAARATCDPPDTVCVCAVGSWRDRWLRENRTRRDANGVSA